jgi:hypothetical protein
MLIIIDESKYKVVVVQSVKTQEMERERERGREGGRCYKGARF